jgi:hypothetical protein
MLHVLDVQYIRRQRIAVRLKRLGDRRISKQCGRQLASPDTSTGEKHHEGIHH